MINASKRSAFLCIALLIPFIYLLANSKDYHPPLKLANSPFTFTETEITAHPGESVQICVDKAAGGLAVFGTTSIVVDAVGNTSPHLSDFAPVTLSFPFGMTQACFDLVVGNSTATEVYQLRIQGVEEYLKIKVESEGMTVGQCGVIPPLGYVAFDEAIAIDRFGNLYTPEMLAISPPVSTSTAFSGGGCGCEEFEAEEISLTLFEPF